jgi:RHS repeat-associated protein
MARLLTVTQDGALVEEYEYDAAGVRIYEMNQRRGIVGRNFSYDDEDRLLTAGTASYQYDADGFLTSKTDGAETTTYDYSSRGELLSATLPDGTLVEYLHDPLGRRIAKKVDGVTVEKYLWQGLTRLLAVYDGADSLVMRFSYADGRMPVSMTTGGSTYYLTYDQVGSLRLVADAAGTVVKNIEYDSFGNILSDSNPGFSVPFGFAGGLHDRDTGLVRFGFRDYDPDVGRWTAKDPILFAGGDTDLYGYAQNNPINFIDSWGLISSQQIGNIIFNETRSLSGANIDQARLNIAHSILNADAKWGKNRSKYAGTAPDTVACIPKSEYDTYLQSQIAAIIAAHQQNAGIDPTNGATNFNFRNNSSSAPFLGMPLQTQVGPLNNSYPTTTLNATGVYANTYKQ